MPFGLICVTIIQESDSWRTLCQNKNKTPRSCVQLIVVSTFKLWLSTISTPSNIWFSKSGLIRNRLQQNVSKRKKLLYKMIRNLIENKNTSAAYIKMACHFIHHHQHTGHTMPYISLSLPSPWHLPLSMPMHAPQHPRLPCTAECRLGEHQLDWQSSLLD